MQFNNDHTVNLWGVPEDLKIYLLCPERAREKNKTQNESPGLYLLLITNTSPSIQSPTNISYTFCLLASDWKYELTETSHVKTQKNLFSEAKQKNHKKNENQIQYQ